MELYHRRLLHYYYVEYTPKYNIPHYAALTDPWHLLRCRLFLRARAPWEGETIELKVALIKAAENWEMLTGGDRSCPIVFDSPHDVPETMELDATRQKAVGCLKVLRNMIGVGPEGWVPTEHYGEAMAHCKRVRELGLAEIEDKEQRARVAAHWPYDDVDKEDYM